MPGMQPTAGDQASGIVFSVVGDELIHAGGEADHFRGDIVDQHCPVDSGGVHVPEKGFGRIAELRDLVEVCPVLFQQLQSGVMKHAERLDMDVTIGDQGRLSGVGPVSERFSEGCAEVPEIRAAGMFIERSSIY
jgi:hypothetical protein